MEAEEEVVFPDVGIRKLLLMSYSVGEMGMEIYTKDALGQAASLFAFGVSDWSGKGQGRRKIPVNVDKMVSLWVDVCTRLATAHDRDEKDAAEAQINDLLTPMLTAPIAQLREFTARLVPALKVEPTVPYIVWRAFEKWNEHFLVNAPDEAVITLKKELATEIVNMVEKDVVPDLRDAMIGALMWRDPEKLKQVKQAVVEAKRTGRKIQAKGRESCLFLTVSQGRGRKPVEVML